MGLARATDGGAVALVSELSLSSKLGLDTTHVAVQGSLSTTSIHRHLGEKLLLHGGASRLVVGEVASHVGADSGDVSTTASRLLGDLACSSRSCQPSSHQQTRWSGGDGCRTQSQ